MNKDGLKNFLIAFILYFWLSLVGNFIAGLISSIFSIDNFILNNLIMLLGSLICFIGIVAYSNDKLKGEFKKFKEKIGFNIKTALGSWAVGFLLMIVANLIINVLIMKGIAPNEEANRKIIEELPIYAFLYMCIFGPVVEELVFRLHFDGIFKEKKYFVLGSGLIFGLLHVMSGFSLLNLVYLIPYSILGFTFARAYSETENIYSSIMIHILHNSLSIIAIFLALWGEGFWAKRIKRK